jgi:carboxypeptidase family protein
MKRLLTIFVAVLVSVATGSDAWGQATAQISGTVRDQSGAVLPGVEVTAIQTDTGIRRAAVTNETGLYVLANLPIGPYRLEAALPGFRTFVQTGIVLQVNTSPLVNPILDVGQVTEQIEVQANAALVETRTSGVGQVIENARILDLPLNGRNVTELIALAGGATPAPIVNGQGGRDPFSKGNISVAGGLNTGLNFTLDGATHVNRFSNSYMSVPFPDALQEFKVETSATGAQNGGSAAGSVSLVTKSGTNDIHGDMFEFVRNGMFNARNAFSPKRDTIKRNQFGGTAGGPIMKNKLFFFGGYQGTRFRQDPADQIAFVPSPAILAGDFTTFASPACNGGRQITLRAPFVNNRVDPAQFSKPAVALAKLLPSTPDACGRIIFGDPNPENDNMAIGRIDYQRNGNHSLFGRYLIDTVNIPPGYDVNKSMLISGTAALGRRGRAQAFTIGDTYLFGSNIVNSLRLTANRIYGAKTAPDFSKTGAAPNDIGIKAYTYQPSRHHNYTVTGAFSSGYAGAGPTTTAIFGVNDDLSIVRGNHQMAFGANTSAWWENQYADQVATPGFTFNGQTTGLGLGDFLLGNVSNFSMGTFLQTYNRSKYVGLYAADTWKVNQELTLTYGLRWEPYFPQINRDGTSVHFDLDAFRKGIKSNRFANTPPGLFYDGDPGFPTGQGFYNQWSNFSPRVGLAWDVAGDGRTSVRIAAGTFYDLPSSNYWLATSVSAPFESQALRTNVKFDDPWANEPGGDPFPLPYGRDVSRDVPWPLHLVANGLDTYDVPNMQVSQWTLSLQKQVGTDWLLSTSYLGNTTTHLWATQHMNPAVYIPGGPCTLEGLTFNPCSSTASTDQRRRFSLENPAFGKYYGAVPRLDFGGKASYNGLLTSIQRRATRGITVNANYTWSHCISDPGGDLSFHTGNPTNAYTNPDSRTFDRGNCTTAGQDRRHNFNLSALAETPRFSNPTLRAVASGWRFSPIIKILSGDYLSVTTNVDVALSGTSNQRVNQILPNPYGDKSVSKYLNPAAFALPATGTYGHSGKGAIAGPATWQFDTALSRTFQLRETQKLEFRAEAFNLTNSFRMNDPVTALNSNTFGQVISAQDPRIMQFALKYFF